ncbi:MAG: DUF3305 domain-containing protein [Pseudomonadota bacterium]|nr:MAG: DUF3305 domain-containing protein [Pseudomonadota bacterium]
MSVGEPTIANSVSVSVVLQRQDVTSGRWSSVRWELLGVVVGEPLAAHDAGRRLIHADTAYRRYLWPGYTLTLHRDSAEDYWHNLMGVNPLVFAVCREDENREPHPFLVTVDGDEATSFSEADDLVLSAPMPAELYKRVENFVVHYYRPQQPKKRQRKNWTEESASAGKASRNRHARADKSA